MIFYYLQNKFLNIFLDFLDFLPFLNLLEFRQCKALWDIQNRVQNYYILKIWLTEQELVSSLWCNYVTVWCKKMDAHVYKSVKNPSQNYSII